MIGDQGVFALPENGGTYEVFEKTVSILLSFIMVLPEAIPRTAAVFITKAA